MPVGRSRGAAGIGGSERGSILVEFGVSALFFLTALFGVMEGARAIYHYNIVASIARDGARWAIVRGAESGRVASALDVQSFVQGRSLGLNPTVNVSWTPNNQPGGTVEVQVVHTFTSVVPIVPIGSLPMSATARGTVLR